MTTEKEKMISGKIYNPGDKELLNARQRAKELCHKYNTLPNSSVNERENLIKNLFGKCESIISIEPNFYCDYGFNISAGKNFCINHNCVILDCAAVTFGDNVWIGPNCGFYTAIHPTNAEERITGVEYAKPITVGNNVWIGGNVVILSGVTIGDNTTIGAGSVVTKDIPSNVVAFGNPCKVIRNI